MFTYVFAYYLKKNNQSEIFEVKNGLDLLRFVIRLDKIRLDK